MSASIDALRHEILDLCVAKGDAQLTEEVIRELANDRSEYVSIAIWLCTDNAPEPSVDLFRSFVQYANTQTTILGAANVWTASANGRLDVILMHEKCGYPIDAALYGAAEKGHPHVISYVLSRGIIPDERVLCIAASNGHTDCLKLLCDLNLYPIDMVLTCAAIHNETECVIYLYDETRLNKQDLQDTIRSTARSGSTGCLSYLVSRTKSNRADYLMDAIYSGNITTVKYVCGYNYDDRLNLFYMDDKIAKAIEALPPSMYYDTLDANQIDRAILLAELGCKMTPRIIEWAKAKKNPRWDDFCRCYANLVRDED
jgi:hypothetical protein